MSIAGTLVVAKRELQGQLASTRVTAVELCRQPLLRWSHGFEMAEEELCRLSRARAVEKAAAEALTLATTVVEIAIRAKGLRQFSSESCSSLHCQGLENLYS